MSTILRKYFFMPAKSYLYKGFSFLSLGLTRLGNKWWHQDLIVFVRYKGQRSNLGHTQTHIYGYWALLNQGVCLRSEAILQGGDYAILLILYDRIWDLRPDALK